MYFKQHIPNFAFNEQKSIEIEGSWEDISKNQTILAFTNDEGFSHFAFSERGPYTKPNPGLLMAVFDGGRKWWVVGLLSEKPSDLPLWISPLEEKSSWKNIELSVAQKKDIESRMNKKAKNE